MDEQAGRSMLRTIVAVHRRALEVAPGPGREPVPAIADAERRIRGLTERAEREGASVRVAFREESATTLTAVVGLDEPVKGAIRSTAPEGIAREEEAHEALRWAAGVAGGARSGRTWLDATRTGASAKRGSEREEGSIDQSYRHGRNREEVLESALKWIEVHRDTRVVGVLGHDVADARRAARQLARAIRHARGGAGTVAAFDAVAPPGRRRFEFDATFNDAMLRAAGRDPRNHAAVWDDTDGTPWGTPSVAVIGNAQALARRGRTRDHATWCAEMLRNIARATGAQLVLAGTEEIYKVLMSGGLLRRAWTFDLDVERNEARENAARKRLRELGW